MPPRRRTVSGDDDAPSETNPIHQVQALIEQRFEEWQNRMQTMIQNALQQQPLPPPPPAASVPPPPPHPSDPVPNIPRPNEDPLPREEGASSNRGDDRQDLRAEDKDLVPLRAFSRTIGLAIIPEKLKIPIFELYRGKSDPFDHVASFESTLCILNASDALKCRLFLTTLKESALRWFNSLPSGAIRNFNEFRSLFTTQFSSVQKPRRNSHSLLQMRQDSDESLRKYITRFQWEMLEIRDLEPTIAHAALKQSLKPGPFRYALGLSKPKTLADLLALANDHIEAEEGDSPAKRERPSSSSSHRSKDRSREKHPASSTARSSTRTSDTRRPLPSRSHQRSRSDKPSHELDQVQHRTPLKVSLAEVVSAAQNKEYFRKPPPPENYRGIAPPNPGQYCAYHRSTGHDTEDCRYLRGLIEDLIKQGKLKQYVNENVSTRREGKAPDTQPPGRSNQVQTIRIQGVVPVIFEEKTQFPYKSIRKPRSKPRSASTPNKILLPIFFSNKDLPSVPNPYHEAIVVSAIINKYFSRRVLVDTGSSVNVLFKSISDKMIIDPSLFNPAAGSIYGFSSEKANAIGRAVLPFSWGNNEKYYGLNTEFLIIDSPAIYDVIIGRPLLNAFQAIVSTYHVAIKFAIGEKIITIKGDLQQSRICFLNAIKNNGKSLADPEGSHIIDLSP